MRKFRQGVRRLGVDWDSMTQTAHTSREYEAELREIRGHLTSMGARCEQALALAIEAFANCDGTQAAEVMRLDTRINQDEIQIDEISVHVLALRQPVAYDLRFVARTLKFVTDLERISDEAVNIAERAISLGAMQISPPTYHVPRMGVITREMLRIALDSFVGGDVEGAKKVLAMDDEVDELLRLTSAAAIEWMQQNPQHVAAMMCVTSTAKYLERIADHATNLAEHVVFLVEGDDVRHRAVASKSIEPH
jgi:phosphate transport system protein